MTSNKPDPEGVRALVQSACFFWESKEHDLTGHEGFEKLVEQFNRLVNEAQTNAVAWAVGVLDDMHNDELFDGQVSEGSVGDKGYKGIKNRLRDRYKAETGVDPAPHYPIHAKLQSTTPISSRGEE